LLRRKKSILMNETCAEQMMPWQFSARRLLSITPTQTTTSCYSYTSSKDLPERPGRQHKSFEIKSTHHHINAFVQRSQDIFSWSRSQQKNIMSVATIATINCAPHTCWHRSDLQPIKQSFFRLAKRLQIDFNLIKYKPDHQSLTFDQSRRNDPCYKTHRRF